MKNEIITIIIILIIASIFGCLDTAQPKNDSKVYGSDYVNFQMPTGWEVHPMPGDGTVIWMKEYPRIRVIEFNSKEKFDLSYNRALNIDNGTYTIIKVNETVNGIEVKIVKTTHANTGDVQDEYFFEKNNKYYHLIGWDFTGWDSVKQVKSRKKIDTAVNTIVTTIN